MFRAQKRAGVGLAVAVTLLSTGNTLAETTASFGWASDYIFRGIQQSESSAWVGLDYSNSNFYIGTWVADVGQGSEVDVYLGYTGSFGEDWSYTLGGTGYFYTDDFDDTYREFNAEVGNSRITFSTALGSYANFDGPTADYTFASLRFGYEGAYALLGSFGSDFDGEYLEVGYEMTVGGFDVGISAVHASSTLVGDSDTSVVFSLGKTIDFRNILLGQKAEQ